MAAIYRILKGTYTRKNPKTNEIERYTKGDNIVFSDKTAKQYGLSRLQKVSDVEQKKLVTNPKKDDGQGGENPPTPKISAAALKLIEEKNLDVSAIKGTGQDGAITKPDVEAFLNGEGNE